MTTSHQPTDTRLASSTPPVRIGRVVAAILVLAPLVIGLALFEGWDPDAPPDVKFAVELHGDQLAIAFNRRVSEDGAKRLFKDATEGAALGDSFFAWRLGALHFMGQGTPQDDAKAVEWWQKAARGKVKWGHFALAWMHQHGRGGLRADPSVALQLYRQAAASGDPYFQLLLGQLLHRGQGFPHDEAEAKIWLDRSAASGEPYASLALAVSALPAR